MALLSAVVACLDECWAFVCWIPVRCVAESTRSVVIQFFSQSGIEFVHSLYWFFFNFYFRFDISASGIVFLSFFFSYAFCLIISIVFFVSGFFFFISLSRSFLSVIAVMNFEMSNSSAVMFSKLHSFSISINLRQKSSGVSISVCLVQKNSPRL